MLLTLEDEPDASERRPLWWKLDIQLEDCTGYEHNDGDSKGNCGDPKTHSVAFCLLHPDYHCGSHLQSAGTSQSFKTRVPPPAQTAQQHHEGR